METEASSTGLYEATPTEAITNAEQLVNPNCLYPSLVDCDEPVSSILNNLTTRTWHKAAEKSLNDNQIKTVGDLSKLSSVKASALKSLKPPNNVFTIREALRKFEKIWLKRSKVDAVTTKPKVNSSNAVVGDNLEIDDLGHLETKEQSPTAAPVVDVQSTPEEEDETMKELYERPSPSPPIDMDEKMDEDEDDNDNEQVTDESAKKEPSEKITGCGENATKLIVNDVPSSEQIGNAAQKSVESAQNTVSTETNTETVTKADFSAQSKPNSMDKANSTEVKKSKAITIQTEATTFVTAETNTETVSLSDFSTQFQPTTKDKANLTEIPKKTFGAQVRKEDLQKKDEIFDEFLNSYMKTLNTAQLSQVLTKVAELMVKK